MQYLTLATMPRIMQNWEPSDQLQVERDYIKLPVNGPLEGDILYLAGTPMTVFSNGIWTIMDPEFFMTKGNVKTTVKTKSGVECNIDLQFPDTLSNVIELNQHGALKLVHRVTGKIFRATFTVDDPEKFCPETCTRVNFYQVWVMLQEVHRNGEDQWEYNTNPVAYLVGDNEICEFFGNCQVSEFDLI
ncbi:hypothetical protein [Vibrio phage vB_pir03]|nr:hypothetical protein [Vibrio phage vB_pir03]